MPSARRPVSRAGTHHRGAARGHRRIRLGHQRPLLGACRGRHGRRRCGDHRDLPGWPGREAPGARARAPARSDLARYDAVRRPARLGRPGHDHLARPRQPDAEAAAQQRAADDAVRDLHDSCGQPGRALLRGRVARSQPGGLVGAPGDGGRPLRAAPRCRARRRRAGCSAYAVRGLCSTRSSPRWPPTGGRGPVWRLASMPVRSSSRTGSRPTRPESHDSHDPDLAIRLLPSNNGASRSEEHA